MSNTKIIDLHEVGGALPQGDVLIESIDALPEGLREVQPVDGRLIVGHSETGHHHFADSTKARFWADDSDPFVGYLVAKGAEPLAQHYAQTSLDEVGGGVVDLIHDRPVMPHDTVRFRGAVKITRQREWTPAGDRMVMD